MIVLGAGTAAASLLKNVGRSAEWHFVGLLDDDPAKRRREIQGVPVLGTLAELAEIASSARCRARGDCDARRNRTGSAAARWSFAAAQGSRR